MCFCDPERHDLLKMVDECEFQFCNYLLVTNGKYAKLVGSHLSRQSNLGLNSLMVLIGGFICLRHSTD